MVPLFHRRRLGPPIVMPVGTLPRAGATDKGERSGACGLTGFPRHGRIGSVQVGDET
jgi:hypothetical protein